MSRKKIVFVIVEGPSDDEALSVLLDQIFDENAVYIHIAHCDLTTAKDECGDYVRGASILNLIGKIVTEYMNNQHFDASCFREIVHIVDMDGAYIPDAAVLNSPKANKPIYSLSGIETNNVLPIIKRNQQKRGCIDKLSSTPTVCGIPYQAYYMSCNLDHVLYDKINLTDEDKEFYSIQFAKKYKTNIQGFIEYMTNSSFAVTNDYLSSWSFIKHDLNSLKRYTNFGICIQRALKGNNT